MLVATKFGDKQELNLMEARATFWHYMHTDMYKRGELSALRCSKYCTVTVMAL